MHKGLLRRARVSSNVAGIATYRRFFVPLLLAGLSLGVPQLRSLTPADQHSAVTASSVLVDPDKAASEMNHHVAGLILILIGTMVICGHRYKKLAFVQQLWPLLFIAAGAFLAVWSDAEIWPRGNLNWTWLLQHDAEARQHKIYAILLIAIGVIEYLRARARLSRKWAPWAFPVLAIFGGVFLFFHDHGGSHDSTGNGQAGSFHMNSPGPQSAARVAQSSAAIIGERDSNHHQHGAEAGKPLPAHDMEGHEASTQLAQHHSHSMTAAMLNIRREHMWFAVVGFCIALCKFLYDASPLHKRVSPYLWANSMILLGVLLVMYTE
jgi:hypothetical protein